MAVRVLSAKVPEELIAALNDVAAHRGMSRNAIVREALERLVAGKPDAGPTLAERQLAAARSTIRRELALRSEIPPARLPAAFRPRR